MIGKLLSMSFTPGMFMGMVYLTLIMWWVTGHSPTKVVESAMDIIVQPLQEISEVLK